MPAFRITQIEIVGLITSLAYQRAKFAALDMNTICPGRFPEPEIYGMMEFDWNEQLSDWRQALGGEFWCLHDGVAAFVNNGLVGNDEDFIKVVSELTTLDQHWRDQELMLDRAIEEYIEHLDKDHRIFCYLNISIDDTDIGPLIFELYSDILPRTCANFKSLCTGECGEHLSYKGTLIHRVVKTCWLQGGDIEFRTGGGGKSIYGVLEDEGYAVHHNRRGILSMANAGKHNNGSQFLVTLQPAAWMDHYHVAFGRLVEGVQVLHRLEHTETFYERPLRTIEIKGCGVVDQRYVLDKLRPPRIKLVVEETDPRVEEILRLILETITEVLAVKEITPDVIDIGDFAAKLRLEFFFEGLDIPQEVFEDTAAYLRRLRRSVLRYIKPLATEVVEAILYDLMMAATTRLGVFGTTLDDVRQTICRATYGQLIDRIDSTFEKDYVKNLIDQLAKTAENMVALIATRLGKIKKRTLAQIGFDKELQRWVRSFVLQEAWEEDELRSPPPSSPSSLVSSECTPGEPRYSPERPDPPRRTKLPATASEFFSMCRYNFPGPCEREEPQKRPPFVEFVEYSKRDLRRARYMDDVKKPPELVRTNKKMESWMKEVVYIKETEWIKQTVFDRDLEHPDHIQEIMYGAMTVGLLDMYFLMDQHVKAREAPVVEDILVPGAIKFRYRPPGSTTISEGCKDMDMGDDGPPRPCDDLDNVPPRAPREEGEEATEPPPAEESTEEEPKAAAQEEAPAAQEELPQPPPQEEAKPAPEEEAKPASEQDAPPPGDEAPAEGEPSPPPQTDHPGVLFKSDNEQASSAWTAPSGSESHPPTHDVTYAGVDVDAMLADVPTLHPEDVNVKSFKWMKPYIVTRGNAAKSNFAEQVHRWAHGEGMCFAGSLSKQSLATRASLLSMTMHLAALIKDSNTLRADIKEFVYDLWELYFQEMFKEALMEHAAGEEPIGDDKGRNLKSLASSSPGGMDPCDASVSESSGEVRPPWPYRHPFWVKYLTEMTKQSLGRVARLSRLPRRLYFNTESELSFDDRMKEWFEYNSFNPVGMRPREVLEYIDLHHVRGVDLETTARSFFRKKVYSQAVLEQSESARLLADAMLADVVGRAVSEAGEATASQEAILRLAADACCSSLDMTAEPPRPCESDTEPGTGTDVADTMPTDTTAAETAAETETEVADTAEASQAADTSAADDAP